MTPPNETPARLLIRCPDGPGIVAAVAGFLAAEGANITASDQHSSDPLGGEFLMRMEFSLPALREHASRDAFAERFASSVGNRLGAWWRIAYATPPPRVAILVSRHEHCLLDLLWRWRRGEHQCEIGMVISNHDDLADQVSGFGLPFEHVASGGDHKRQAEERMLELLEGRVDLVVLARYMQILSGGFLDRLAAPVINIHHSFLPAFVGADPYRRAHDRGVKVIGATAHYVTEDLDAGPIIEQDVARVSHRDGVAAMERVGAEIERTVLARAVRWHLEDRVIVHGDRTVVFGS